ncbi:MAG: hypothetical protein A3G87_03560 [Omnitrophica bacterium RIFCSPLOWO2_12_FULL_50_11]|nr:MAG: hypothetical protein A3G87_03560 [Omnitrophica bacterium RIFCSPLOWO2_12_FULL_50_11]
MNLALLGGLILLILAGAYWGYGRFLTRSYGLLRNSKTPAAEVNDGIDFIPTPKRFLLGQHFSAIAAAGPIVGPILAGLWFGWLPVLLWIICGAIFSGAVHDFTSLFASVRHRGRSIAEIVKEHLGEKAYYLFLIFLWFSLIYVITAFTDLTSSSFAEPQLGGGVASSSLLYLILGVTLGLCLRFLRVSLGAATFVFVPLIVLVIWLGPHLPLQLEPLGPFQPRQIWNAVLLGYCLIASLVPIWILLQPRGYLGGIFLYGTLAAGLIGLAIGGETVTYPAFLGFVNTKGMPLFPFLFVTVACGACSGFHGIVCSGTTSKQIARETDCLMVGYGGMLLESLVAFLALATVMILTPASPLVSSSPDRIYAEGLSSLVTHLGLPRELARSFVLLAFATFIYDTLDVATRLARYILQELTGWKGFWGSFHATWLSLLIPFFCVTIQATDSSGQLIPAWKIFWTLFGTSNQLLAALTLLTLSVWLMRTGKAWWISALPMLFMMTMTLWSLGLMIRPLILSERGLSFSFDGVGVTALALLILSVLLITEAVRTILTQKTKMVSDTGV